MDIRQGAYQIVKTLYDAGYIAYFAGGWVRDFLMKHPSDDIDIATNAPPEVILDLFPHTVKVGLAFGVILVLIEGHSFEVATFRTEKGYTDGRRPSEILLSSEQEDAQRRDFTINGLFYDPILDKIYDYVGGISDIEKGIIRTIGDPQERFSEDRLRMIRAIRFASRFSFEIEEQTQKAIQKHAATLLPAVAVERIWQEFHKMAKYPLFTKAIEQMHHLGLLSVIFSDLQECTSEEIKNRIEKLHHLPKGTPPILYFLELFPHMSLEEILKISEDFRISGEEGKLLEFAFKGKQLLLKEETSPKAIGNSEWAYLYAHHFFPITLQAMIARYSKEQQKELIEKHAHRKESLLPHVQRIVERKPLVTAALLKEQGIPPGKLMGELLRASEYIAITEDLHDPKEVIEKLKEMPLWPK
jgi:poly(A) polymerase